MPPRRKSECLSSYAVDTTPSFQDEKFIEQLLHFVGANDEVSLLTMTAVALGAECYQVDLGQQIVVDARLDFINFCAKQGYCAAKVVHLLKWLCTFQERVEDGCNTQEMQEEVIAFVTSEVEEEWKWKRALQAEEALWEVQSSSKTSARRGHRAAEKVVEETEAVSTVPKENIYLQREDIGPFSTWLIQGIVQHASLYHYVATHARMVGEPEEFNYFLEVPVSAPPLRNALAPESVPQEPPLAKAQQDVEEQRASELETYKKEYEEAMALEQLRLQTIQNERDMKVFIENEGSMRAVEDTYESLQVDLSKRQRQILERITAAEKALGIFPFVQPQ
ncbi:uncharacterized protein TEOVI_000394000 [Trypanosoma equiperdum]|uniref:Uncharacterized protein n=2 Tax=Trypanozoon TaxID=39700 RepID=Q57XA0_TRYB2|nr:hypothetical protein, conserved [Trypanosoma brucei brucei TREU927]AAX69769.1 hypothetical protein, conserved [Trypanosoma brucei]AAZ12548.1 hypothetical protein, conserved [Trypanosoma brucei brucei TREU927]SCU72364.1 hypothetical protein, conserved [Trypanosoma equiperdum]